MEINTSTASLRPPVDFHAWIEEVKPDLKPPVGNKLLYGDGQHKVMIVGGPNVREDYHLEIGEEIFLQLVGDMCLEVMEHGKPKSVVIKEGEIFLLPGRVPHSPQRKAGTVGVVLERERLPTELDGLTWYNKSPEGTNVLYQEFFHCEDLGVQLKPVIERFFASEAYTTRIPVKDYEGAETPIKVDSEITLHTPFSLRDWITSVAKKNPSNATVLFGAGAVDPKFAPFEYLAIVMTGPVDAWKAMQPANKGETFFYQMEGSSICYVQEEGGAETPFELGPGFVFLVPGGSRFRVRADFGEGACLVITNSVVA